MSSRDGIRPGPTGGDTAAVRTSSRAPRRAGRSAVRPRKRREPLSAERLEVLAALAVTRTVELRIEKLVLGGDGLGRWRGLPIFVTRTAPGDLVEARIVERRPSYARAEVERLLESGPAATGGALPVLRPLRRLPASAHRRRSAAAFEGGGRRRDAAAFGWNRPGGDRRLPLRAACRRASVGLPSARAAPRGERQEGACPELVCGAGAATTCWKSTGARCWRPRLRLACLDCRRCWLRR